jgi:molecular chaperone GrpE
MTDRNSDSHTAGPDEKTTVLPETAVALVEMERLQGELVAAEERAKNHWEQYLRALAEVDNVRKRAAKDLENTRQFAVEKFAADVIGVKDSLELALANLDKADVASLVEGEKATLRLLAKAFEKAQIEEINPEGQAFNPELHEAMMAQPGDAPPNTVLSVIQRSYALNAALRHARRSGVGASRLREQADQRDIFLLETKRPGLQLGAHGSIPKKSEWSFVWLR